MNLGVDAYNLAHDHRGMGRVVRQTLRDLRERGVTPTLIVPKTSDAWMVSEEFALPVTSSSQVARAGFDLVWYPWNGMRFAPHTRSAVTIHDPFAFTRAHRNPIARRREQQPIRRALRCADHVIAVSRWTAGQLEMLFGIKPPRLRVIENVPDPFWQPAGPGEEIPYFFFLGGPDARKNAAFLFRAYDRAFGAGGPELIAAGTLSAADEDAFAAMAAPRRRVHPDDEALRRLYSGALAVLLPSLDEGFGLPALEAMACGAPVIASHAGGLIETCGDAALFADARSESDWARALQRILESPSLAEQLRVRGSERIARCRQGALAEALLAAAAGPRYDLT